MSYKAFKEKFVVCERGEEDGTATVALFTNDRRGNRIPVFLETAGDAVIEIGEFMIAMGQSAKRGDIQPESLDEPFNRFVAKARLSKDGKLYIWTDGEHEDNVIYDDHIVHLID